MPAYLTGVEVVGDARLRLNALPLSVGVLIVEGRDDRRIMQPRCIRPDIVVVAGGKPRLLESFDRLRPQEHSRIVFVFDCDFDAPIADALPRQANVAITSHPSAETDLVALGAIERVVSELLPSTADLAADTAEIVNRAVAVAEPFGRLRRASRVHGLGLDFDGLEIKRVRRRSQGSVTMDRACDVMLSRSTPSRSISPDELRALAVVGGGGLAACAGHDLVAALRAVLHQDFGVVERDLLQLEGMLRLAFSEEMFGRWGVVDRIRRWESETGCRVLA
jgi:hypothetical protein